MKYSYVLGWALFSKVKNIEIFTFRIVPIDEKNYIKILARFKSFLRLLNEVEVLSMSGAAVVWPKLAFCVLACFKNNLNLY